MLVALAVELACDAPIHQKRAVLTLPGYFRPTKLWDLLVVNEGRLVAALEFKSHVGPSFSNNFNNRTEEAIGTSHDLWTAYREGAFGKQERPFVGWLMVVEDAPKSRTAVKDNSPHFPVLAEFAGASYQQRYDFFVPALGAGTALQLRRRHRDPTHSDCRWRLFRAFRHDRAALLRSGFGGAYCNGSGSLSAFCCQCYV